MEGLEDYLLYAVICVLLSVIALLALTRQQREAILTYLPLASRGRRASTSTTPPRSLSPETKIPSNALPPQDYKDIFPPSSRETLARATEKLSLAQKEKLLGRHLVDGEFRKGLIPFTADYRECGPSTYTPTEISVEEIKALGDFPDYAELSGVPLPRPYKEFDIDRALARPYRPFRWAYHQTMCSYNPK